jgi:hypothetical protein
MILSIAFTALLRLWDDMESEVGADVADGEATLCFRVTSSLQIGAIRRRLLP